MTRFLLVPGMCHGAWWYQPLAERLTSLGHEALAVTPTGLEAEPDVDDAVAALDQLVGSSPRSGARDVVLVGHSYGGLLVTAAADARPDLVRAIVYLDAFLPEDGDSAWSLTSEEQRAWYVGDAGASGDTVAPLPFFEERARPHPVGTLLQRITLAGAYREVPRRVYVEALQWPEPTPMATSIARAHADPGVEHVAWDTRHSVMHDGPERVLELLRGL